MSTSRFLVIGLDGATFDVINPWLEEGRLPCLQKLIESGVSGPLRSTILPGTPIAWSSFSTGKNPGKHRIFEFMRRVPGTYNMAPTNAANRIGPDLWTILSSHGKNVGILNVPYTYPPIMVNGYIITGMMTPHRLCEYTFPQSLAQELDSALGGYQIHPKEAFNDLNISGFLKDLFQYTEHRTKAALYLLKNKPWDFFMVVLNGTDRITHSLFKYLDPHHQYYSPQKAEIWAHYVADYFTKVDQCCSRIIEAAGDNVTIMIVSDHGMRSLHGYVHLNNYLLARGYLQFKKTWLTRIKTALFRIGFTPERLYRLLIRLKLAKLRKRMDKGKTRGLLKRFSVSFGDVDWRKTSAYQLIGGHLYLNVKNREPQGLVSPNEEYFQLRNQLSKELKQLTDPNTGQRLIEHVWFREEVYHGEYVEEAPDILFLPAEPYSRFTEYEFASNKLVSKPPGISGDHSMNGIFIFNGPGVKSGYQIKDAQIIDCAPTILYSLGFGIPSDIDGRVLTQAFKPSFLSANPVRLVSPIKDLQPKHVGLTQEDEEKVKSRLRDLGYLG